jgi:hypothetical protein
MKKLSKWHLGSIAGTLIVVVAVGLFLQETFAPSSYGVCTVGFNYRKEPIYWFGVITQEGKCGNDVGGKRVGESYSGGGGVACGCSIRPGEQATVRWTFDKPLADIERGVPDESHEVHVTVPVPESRQSRYLQVHFMADNHVVLDWRDDFGFSRVNAKTGAIDDKQPQ